MTTPNQHRPFRTVLVPTDLSTGSVAPLDRALMLPLAPGARIDIVHAVSDASGKTETDARAALAREVDRARSRAPNVEVTAAVVRGLPHDEIVRRARSVDAELVVIGPHARRPVRDVFLGSTAARVTRMGETPVLVVRGAAKAAYGKPLVATDLEDTLPELASLALKVVGGRATVYVVHAVHVPFEGFVAPSAAARERLHGRAEEEARTKLERVLSPYQDFARWIPRVRAGDARTILVDEATRLEADVVVVGTHGRSGLAHVLVGSVAEWTLANAPCDVLVARPVRFSFELP